jgi:CubicO group peptidase (beta-lactamase class C family)
MHVPGAALAVVRDGRVVKARAYGLANVELGVAATPDTVFEIGSITKQFTGAAVALLAAEGKLSPADPIAKHLDGVPEAWRGITVEHLLTHSSGIRNYLDVPGMFEETTRAGVTHDSVARMMLDRLPLEFAPGETWTYSNSAYLLLGRIAEKASGQDYWRLLDDRIFRPLGMRATRSSDPNAIVPGRAAGYAWNGERLERRPALTESAFAAGSLLSTVLDLAKWDAGLLAGRPLDAATLERLWTPRPAAGGAPAPFAYGYGWFVETRHGRRVVLHDGGTPGFSSVIYRAVDDRTTVILLTNHADVVLEHLAVEIAGLYVPALAAPPTLAADPEPSRTRHVEAAVRGLLTGAPDPTAFTPAMQSFLRTPTSTGLWQWVAGGRLLESFRYGEEEDTKDGRVVRYRAVLGGANRWFSATLAPDGRIARVYWW